MQHQQGLVVWSLDVHSLWFLRTPTWFVHTWIVVWDYDIKCVM